MSSKEEEEVNSIVNDAINLRRSQDAYERRYFEGLPSCIQKTLFVQPANSSSEGIEASLEIYKNAQELFYTKQYLKALSLFEEAIACIWFVKQRENAPSWREKGVRDDLIRVVRLDNSLAVDCLEKIAVCLFELKQWKESLSICDQALKLNSKSSVSLFTRARCHLKMKTFDCEEVAIRDLLRASEIDSKNEEIKNLLYICREALETQNSKTKQAFGGIFNKPGVRLITEESEDLKKIKRKNLAQEEIKIDKNVVKTELDELELEAAKMAGLDVNDPAMLSLLLSLSTDKGRELFEKEDLRLTKVEKRQQAWKWLCFAIFTLIIVGICIQYWLKSLTKGKKVEYLGFSGKMEL